MSAESLIPRLCLPANAHVISTKEGTGQLERPPSSTSSAHGVRVGRRPRAEQGEGRIQRRLLNRHGRQRGAGGAGPIAPRFASGVVGGPWAPRHPLEAEAGRIKAK